MNTRERKGDFETLAAIVDRSIEEFIDDAALSIGSRSFSHCTKLTNVDLPVATSIGSAAFNNCSALISINIPVAVDIGNSGFAGCKALTSIDLPAVTSIVNGLFADCSALTDVDLHAVTQFADYSFMRCNNLVSVIIRTPSTVAKAGGLNVFPSSQNLIIYVPDDLVSSYKEATNWSRNPDRIKPLSELPE